MFKQYSGVLERLVKYAELTQNQFLRVGSGERRHYTNTATDL
jgi:hypothetical protein